MASFVETSQVMGTFLSITWFGERANGAAKAVESYFRHMEGLCSRFSSESEISRISASAGIEAVPISEEVREVLEEALSVARFTKGVFDPTIGTVSSLWSIGQRNERIPTEEERAEAFSLVDYEKLILGESTAFLAEKGMCLDVGGIAKEVALSQAATFCEDRGEAMLINAGGDVATVGEKPDGSLWRIGIQHPRKRNTLVATVALSGFDMVETSGDYRRFLLTDEVFQSHIFQKDRQVSPLVSATLVYRRTGRHPPFNGTACMAGGLPRVKTWLEACPLVEGIFITADLTVYVTEGISSMVKVLTSDVTRKALLLHNR